MATFVRARRPVIRAIPEPLIVRVNEATWVPSGMHGTYKTYASATLIPSGMHANPATDNSLTLAVTLKKLIASGVHPDRAHALVRRAHSHVHQGRMLKRRGFTHRSAGMGDEVSDAAAARLSTIIADATKVQDSHKLMISNMANWEERSPGWVTTDDELRRTFQDQLTGLKNQFVQRSLPVLGVEFPYQIERVDPAGAIVLAVRDDIQNTVDLLDQRKSQQVLQKTISELSKIPLPSGMPSFNFPNIDIPWYVWGAGIGVGLLTLKQMLK